MSQHPDITPQQLEKANDCWVREYMAETLARKEQQK
jgi:hypothetical protein